MVISESLALDTGPGHHSTLRPRPQVSRGAGLALITCHEAKPAWRGQFSWHGDKFTRIQQASFLASYSSQSDNAGVAENENGECVMGLTTDTIKNILNRGGLLYHVPTLVFVLPPEPGPRVSSVRLWSWPGLGCQVADILRPAHASIFGHTQFSQFPQTAPSLQSRVDIDRDNTSHRSNVTKLTQLVNRESINFMKRTKCYSD